MLLIQLYPETKRSLVPSFFHTAARSGVARFQDTVRLDTVSTTLRSKLNCAKQFVLYFYGKSYKQMRVVVLNLGMPKWREICEACWVIPLQLFVGLFHRFFTWTCAWREHGTVGNS